MTSIFYPDCDAASESGRFVLQACSPHNGTINHQDGRPPSDDEFAFKYREHQGDFRYQLFDQGKLVWTRWQGGKENSPHELVVSNDGWSILRTHGFIPELIAVSPTGQDTIRVCIAPQRQADESNGDEKSPRSQENTWEGEHVAWTTAGVYWTSHSWRYFLHANQTDYFVWRPYWGQRLVIDLQQSRLLSATEHDPALELALRTAETEWAFTLLQELAEQTTEIQQLLGIRNRDEAGIPSNPLVQKLRKATAAILLAGVHGDLRCVQFLRRLDSLDYASYSTGTTTMTSGWWLEVQHFRPIAQHSLRLLDEIPSGFPAYHFTKDKRRFPLPEVIGDRYERTTQLKRTMNAGEVLSLLGAPDHVRRKSHPKEGRYGRIEVWEYDFRIRRQWRSLCITWQGEHRKAEIANVEECTPSWLNSTDRLLEILTF